MLNIQAGRAVIGPFMAVVLVFLAPLGISALSGCNPSAHPEATGKQEALGSPTSQTQSGSAELEAKIKDGFNTDEQLRTASLGVQANVDRNEATLTGTVESEAVKSRAIETAKHAHAGLVVKSNIEVDPGCCGPERGNQMRKMHGMPGHENMPH